MKSKFNLKNLIFYSLIFISLLKTPLFSNPGYKPNLRVKGYEKYKTGVSAEIKYQKELSKLEKKLEQQGKINGICSIVISDIAEGTPLYIGSVGMAANTLKKSLRGRVEKKRIFNDKDFINYILEHNEKDKKIRRMYIMGHGNEDSFWLKVTEKKNGKDVLKMPEDKDFFDLIDLYNLPEEKIKEIRDCFTKDAVIKLYTCHAAADKGFVEKPITQKLADFFDVKVIGANAWCSIQSVKNKNNKLDIYMFPPSREYFKARWGYRDSLFTGKARFIQFEPKE